MIIVAVNPIVPYRIPFHMKTILVTTDLSEESKRAFGQAKELALALDAKIMLVAVIEDPSQAALAYALDFPVYPDPDIHTQLLHKVQNELKDLSQLHFQGVKWECSVVDATGPVHTEIINFARNHKADLIVICTHGRTGVSRLFIGSIAEKVVRESHCPVLTVPVVNKLP